MPLHPHPPTHSKHAIVLADKKLGSNVTVHETIRVKSAVWDDAGARCCCPCPLPLPPWPPTATMGPGAPAGWRPDLP